MKFLFALISMFFVIEDRPVLDEIKLEKTQRVLSTFSGAIDETKTFHLILTKNLKAKKHNILPYIFENNTITEMPVIEFENKFELLSYHVKGEAITLITQTKIDRETSIDVMDINTFDGSVLRSEQVFASDDLKTVLRGDDKNVLIYVVEKELAMVTINSAQDHTESYLTVNNENRDFINDLQNQPLDAINTSEYVQNGSINNYKAYLNNDDVVITKDHARYDDFKMVKLSTSIEGQQFSKIETVKNENIGKFKKSSAFMYGDKIFLLNVSKKEAQIDIVDAKDKSRKSLDLFSPELLSKSSNKESALDFSKKASKNANEPTITVNKSSKDSFKIRMDYVNKNNYNYYYNWWWHHDCMMQNMMWQQNQMLQQQLQQQSQMMRNMSTGFGPNATQADFYIDQISEMKSNDSSFEIAINNNGELLQASEVVTQYKNIDKKKIIDKLNDDRYLRHVSTAFRNDSYTYMAYDKTSESFKVFSKELN